LSGLIVVHGRDADRGSAAGGKARFVTADPTDPAQLDHLAEQAGPVAQGQLNHRRGHCRRRRPHRHLIRAARQERRRIPGRHFLRYMSRRAVPEPKAVKNRVHLDLISDAFDAETDRLLSMGAHRLRDLQGDKSRWTPASASKATSST
jgi:hypothetical protein